MRAYVRSGGKWGRDTVSDSAIFVILFRRRARRDPIKRTARVAYAPHYLHPAGDVRSTCTAHGGALVSGKTFRRTGRPFRVRPRAARVRAGRFLRVVRLCVRARAAKRALAPAHTDPGSPVTYEIRQQSTCNTVV